MKRVIRSNCPLETLLLLTDIKSDKVAFIPAKFGPEKTPLEETKGKVQCQECGAKLVKTKGQK